MGSCSSIQTIPVETVNEDKPKWTFAVQVRDEFLRDKISNISAGFRLINNNTAEYTAAGNDKIGSIRWSRGFTAGRHVIEFIYPEHLRADGARVGLGTSATMLGGDKHDIVGNKGSLAIDLELNRAVRDGIPLRRFPLAKSLPDWFFMYLDLDAGTVQFGSDTEYYGVAFTGVQSLTGPLYPIVTASKQGAIIGIVYRGEGKEIDGPLRKRRTLQVQEAKTLKGTRRR